MDFTAFENFVNGIIKLVSKIFSLWLVDINVADLGEDNANVNTIMKEIKNLFGLFGGKTEEAE